VALVLGILVFTFQRQQFQLRSLFLGTFTWYSKLFLHVFLVKSLTFFDASILFPINKLSIVVVSTFVSFLGFKEKMSNRNWLGFALAIVSIMLLSFG